MCEKDHGASHEASLQESLEDQVPDGTDESLTGA